VRSSDFLPCAGQQRRAQQCRQVVAIAAGPPCSHSTKAVAPAPGAARTSPSPRPRSRLTARRRECLKLAAHGYRGLNSLLGGLRPLWRGRGVPQLKPPGGLRALCGGPCGHPPQFEPLADRCPADLRASPARPSVKLSEVKLSLFLVSLATGSADCRGCAEQGGGPEGPVTVGGRPYLLSGSLWGCLGREQVKPRTRYACDCHGSWERVVEGLLRQGG
jgi:hypothetical protein